MVVEMGSHTFHRGRLAAFPRVYAADGLKVRQRVLGRMVGYSTTKLDRVDRVVHRWARVRAGCRAQVPPLIQTMESQVLVPTRFSPVQ